MARVTATSGASEEPGTPVELRPLPVEYYDLSSRLVRLTELMPEIADAAVFRRAEEKQRWLIEQVQAVIDGTLGRLPCHLCENAWLTVTSLSRYRVCVRHDLVTFLLREQYGRPEASKGPLGTAAPWLPDSNGSGR